MVHVNEVPRIMPTLMNINLLPKLLEKSDIKDSRCRWNQYEFMEWVDKRNNNVGWLTYVW